MLVRNVQNETWYYNYMQSNKVFVNGSEKHNKVGDHQNRLPFTEGPQGQGSNIYHDYTMN